LQIGPFLFLTVNYVENRVFVENIFTKIQIAESIQIRNNNLTEYNPVPVQKNTGLLTQVERVLHQNYFEHNSQHYERLDRISTKSMW
jgi:hypothetical protein